MQLTIIDDDMAALRTLSRALTDRGHAVTAFQSAEAFSESLAHASPDAALVAFHLPGMDGAALLERLRADGHRIPVIFLLDRAEKPALIEGAVAFLEKPYAESALAAALARAAEVTHRQRVSEVSREELRSRWRTLTPREQQVCSQLALGRITRQIAAELGAREKTIKVHRARVMAKMGARSVSELVRSIGRLRETPVYLPSGEVQTPIPSAVEDSRRAIR
jgi:FixJ family two-component response regulator